jgi:hypothetical protein
MANAQLAGLGTIFGSVLTGAATSTAAGGWTLPWGGVSKASAVQLSAMLNSYDQACEATPPNTIQAEIIAGQMSAIAGLPSGVATQIASLSRPAVMTDTSAREGAITAILVALG